MFQVRCINPMASLLYLVTWLPTFKIVMLSVSDIEEMSFVDRLKAMEAIWASVQNDLESAKSPDWHKNVLSERADKIADGNAQFISLEELRNSRPK